MKSDRDYSVYGNVAYAPERESRRRARTNTRVDTHSRPKAQVREAGEVAVVGVIGCALVIALALQVVNSYATLAASSDQGFSLIIRCKSFKNRRQSSEHNTKRPSMQLI
ncbi:MAG: hypothetical protein R3Y07_05710 [Eubacteriales bacterium]